MHSIAAKLEGARKKRSRSKGKAREILAIPEYYTALEAPEIIDSVRNFDDPSNLEFFSTAISSARTRNFFVDFGDSQAWSGFDLGPDEYGPLVASTRPASLNTRWINIWLPHTQKDLIKLLARQYDFTPRLLGFMHSNPVKPARSLRTSRSASLRSSSLRSKADAEAKANAEGSQMGSSADTEEGIGMDEIDINIEPDLSKTLNQFALASDLWHYSTMDWGRRYICVGFNQLHTIQTAVNPADDQDDFSEDTPNCARVWSWLILCEDKTVITISEDPYAFHNGPLNAREQRNLGVIRRNLINVFRQCSKAHDPLADINPLVLPLRTRVGNSEREEHHRNADVPGLLFYYLFDDWLSIYSLIARRDNRFAIELNTLRLRMLEKADLTIVDRLHHLGCQLAVLKRVYKGYDLLIDRLLGKREVSQASLQNSYQDPGPGPDGLSASMSSSQPGMTAHHHGGIGGGESRVFGVFFSSAAKVRFERLQHRIQLYAMNEVNECLNQKESLVFMNFNLLSMKEALTVERLTEVTLLLAEVTILFMPVSLLTGYFSCQFTDVDFRTSAFWKWFAGVFAMSVVTLVGFSFVAGTKEGKIITKPLTRRLMESSLVRFGKRRRRGMGA